MDDNNYSTLAQFKSLIDNCMSDMETHDCIQEIFKPDSDINYQIPATECIKLESPEIIGCTALHLALRDNKTGSFEKLLIRGADFTIKSNKGRTVLHQAIERSYNKSKECWKLKGQLTHSRASLVLSAHVKHNILANPCDNNGMSHFHIACMFNHMGAVRYFLDGGVSPNEAVKNNSARLPGYTPLHIAARYCCLETTQLLLQHGADKHSRDVKGTTPLHLLVERRMEIMDHMYMDSRAPFDFFKEELELNERIVKLFISEVGTQDYAGLSVFQAACTLQDAPLVEKMLERGEDLLHCVREDSPVWPGYTALHFAARYHFETVKLLLSRGANVLAKDAAGVTPFDLCLERLKAEDFLVVLRRAMRQLNVDDILFSDGTTKLTDFVSAMKNKTKFIAFLTTALEDVNMFIPHDSPLWPGYTPLHLAAVFPKRTPLIGKLYETADYVEEECSKNHYNCEETEETLYTLRVVLLLRLEADVTIRDARGSTPIHLAFPRKDQDIFHWLLTNQRKILNPVDGSGLSHLHIACALRRQDFVERTLSVSSDDVNDRVTYGFEYTIIDWNERKIRRFSVNAGSTLLHIAVAACDFAMIETLLRFNANVLARDSLGMTPIHLMIRSTELHGDVGYRRFKELLLSGDNLIDCVTDFGLSHLHVASYADDAAAIAKLLDAGADIEATIRCEPSEGGQNDSLAFLTPYDSYTPLLMAIHKKNELASETLAKRGAVISAKDAVLLDKMFRKSSCRRDIFVKTVKSDATMQKRIAESFGFSMLHLAFIRNDVDSVTQLLRNGADPNAQINSSFPAWSGFSPLHMIDHLTCNDFDVQSKITELLLDHGADVTLANSAGNTPVLEFFYYNYYEDCDNLALMLRHQKDYSMNPINPKGVSHFHAACISGSAALVEEFLKHGVDVNLKIDCFSNFHGSYTPLHLAVHYNLGDTIDVLLKYGADVNARDRLGNTPFHTAAQHSMNFENLFDRLVSAGADVHARNRLGSTAFEELTDITPSGKVIELLVKHGYRLNCFNPLTQQGLIGLALERDTADLSRNPFYEAIVEAYSDASNLDDMGRTPMHNIVSCRGSNASAEAVRGLLEIGCDIDHQDEHGRTALHCASSFCNGDGIAGLLGYGADVNITDFNEQTAITYFLGRSILKNWNWDSIEYIVNAFVKHIYKLNLLKLHVNELNWNAYSKMIHRANVTGQFILECQDELEEAKKRTIDSLSISLFDLLSSETRVIAAYPNMPLVQRQAIGAVFKTDQNLRQDFPQLYCMLLLQYRKTLARSSVIESAKYSLNTQIGFNMPDLCSNIIFRFLTNQDLKNLISSTNV